tara:strand:+ start:156 stop:407 length:252 start_codon:yes stop_codon:yes gene_type:complete
MSAIIIKKRTVASVQVIYYMPDYKNILNEFVWQTEDITPEFPRIGKFIKYWDENIEGLIRDIYVYDHGIEQKVRHVDRRYRLN